jgi:lipoprotein-releasing system ATP-binding protein
MLELRSVTKSFDGPQGSLAILDGIDLTLRPGESCSIMGPSGSGKSTLLAILGALEPPSSGEYTLAGEAPFELAPEAQAAFRNRRVGFVFQDHCLLPQLNVLENVLVPLLASGGAPGEARARELIGLVGLTPRIEHRPAELSGGEKQRAAIARALVRDPLLVLCDEPTGNLDRKSAESVAGLLESLTGRILVVVTHSPELAARFERRFELRDGRLYTT